jgi:pimeloyl-ACP methyl ester carboxylesterase
MEQTIQLCTARDGTRIAWASVGSGPPLVKAANWLNHLEYDWESPIWKHVFRELTRRFHLVRYDERGNGLSDWDVDDLAFEAFVDDLDTVVAAAGLDRFSLLGVSQGCAVSIAYAVRYPQRVDRLVLYGGFAHGWIHGSASTVARHEAMTTLMQQGWGRDNPAFRRLFTALYVPDGTHEQQQWFDDLQRVTTSPDNAVRLLHAIGAIDVRDLLPRVTVPTLVLHARDDAVVPFGNGRALAATIPGARFVPLPGRNHLLLEHDPGWDRFLSETVSFLLGAEASDTDVAPVSEAPLTDWLVTGGALGGGFGQRIAAELGVSSPALDPARMPDAFNPGRVLADRYRLESVLGSGGGGVVARARDLMLERDVAVKVIVGAARDVRWRERVLREARAAAALNHPSIAAIHDMGEHDGVPYLVMELVDGPSLAERPPATVRQAVEVAAAVCNALDHAHRRGLVHRDLKPANLVMTAGEDGPAVKLVDLGIALGSGQERLTRTGHLVGTPAYLAPEQARGEPVDARTDLYALGVMLYEWVVGDPPFEGDDPMAVVAQHVHAEPSPLRERRPEVSEHLQELVLQLLAKNPAARPQTAAEVRERLIALEV